MSPFLRFARRSTESLAGAGRVPGSCREVLDTRALQLDASDSHPEVVLAEALQAIGAPPPVYHFLVQVGAERFEVDFAYPEAMLLIEVDGYGPHTTPEAFEEDRRRQNLLVDRGVHGAAVHTEPGRSIGRTRSPRRSTIGDEPRTAAAS